MKCAYHFETEAVTQCEKCGKPLCGKCAEPHSPPLCCNCAKSKKFILTESERNTVLLSAALGLLAIYWSVISYMRGTDTEYKSTVKFLLMTFCSAYIMAGIPFGWHALSLITYDLFRYVPIIGGKIYVCVKFLLSFLIGIIAMPIYIVKFLVRIKKAR